MPIQKLGRWISTDEKGYLINECGWEQIQSPWLNLVNDLREACIDKLGDRLYSLYLRGSVPRGLAVAGVSDLDSVIILQSAIAPNPEATLKEIEEKLLKKYRFCLKVEMAVISPEEIKSSNSPWQATLQVQGLCIHGEDLRSQLPQFKPSVDLITHAFDLKEDITETQTYLRELSPSHANFDSEIKAQCSWISKRIVRSGFELVMETEGGFTRDLYLCYECFTRYFPDQESLMYKALELSVQPSNNCSGILMFLSHFGSWLVNQIESSFSYDDHPINL